MRVLLLGVGMQGRAALHDLARADWVSEVVAVDRDPAAFDAWVREHSGGNARLEQLDAADLAALDRHMARADVAIDLLPVSYIDRVLDAAIRHRVHLVNTFYTTPDMRRRADEIAAAGITVLPEFGLDPGIDLVLLGEAVRMLDSIDEIASYGAGIPAEDAADNPLRYKVSWTFEGVLRTYRRPSRLIRNGRLVEIDATRTFSPENVHAVHVAGVGDLDAHPNGDAVEYVEQLGLDRGSCASVGRYTMRWPGHAAFWHTAVGLHLLDEGPVVVDGVAVDRIRYLAAALGPHLQYAPGESDLAILKLEVRGRRDGKPTAVGMQVVARRDPVTGLSGMSRTVGYTAAIGARLIAEGGNVAPGLLAPVRDVPYRPFVDALAERGIDVRVEVGDTG